MFNSIRNQAEAGFTMVEIMVVVVATAVLMPLVIYSIGALYTDNINSAGRTTQDTDTLGVLRSIEGELSYTNGWITSLAVGKPLGPTNSTSVSETWSYCGTNGAGDCASSVKRVLITTSNATDKALSDSTRLLVFANTGGICDPAISTTVKVAQIYFVAPDVTTPTQNDLYRRTILNPAADTICNGVVPYQKTTCAASVLSQAGCKDSTNTSHQDAVLLTNVTAFNVDYFTASNDTSAIANEYTATPVAITGAQTIKITIATQTSINGTLTPNTADIRVTRPN